MNKIIFWSLLIFFLIFNIKSSSATSPSCNAGDTQVNVDINGDVTCQSTSGSWSYVIDSPATLNAEATAQEAQEAALNTPINLFNVNLFMEQLAASSLLTDINISPYFGEFEALLSFKNFQGAANFIAALFNGGKVTQQEIESVDTILENQQINLDSYNSQINVAY